MASHRNVIALVFGLSAALAPAIAGCAAAQPPPELIDARRMYSEARDGAARQLVPADVHVAAEALARAERAFAQDPESLWARDLAYVAQRKAQLAEAKAELAGAYRDKASAEADLERQKAELAESMKAQLSQTRAEVAAQRMVLAEKQQELTAEQRARRDAERRANEAMARLEKLVVIHEEVRGTVITLNGAVIFASGQSTLLPIARDKLREVARALVETPTGTIVVEGHTDSTGSAALNDELSQRRADAVRTYLVEQGVAADRIRAIGLGSHRPIADNSTPEGRANNRRVEIVIERP